ncbi:aspartyl-phosphate phosphatase Spo0E family protein [Paenibacillus psychroresistens]|nr:aspartyl-phosphate phosphatase Spo0E family protein [Paenibacillus psychroresistens]
MGLATKMKVGSCREQHKSWDQDLSPQWYYRSSKTASPEQFLEDEIYFLRRRMEQMFNQEQSLTSDSVLELSHLLDHKINEYMYKTYRNR